jgi:tRNA (guanine37-N1)-methyltransferase
VDDQICIGNYVLTGGELPAMIIADSVVRLIPGVLGGENSAEIESFQQDDENIEFPQYTRPAEFKGHKVPDVLLNGHHAEIEKWRLSEKRKSDDEVN